MNYSKILLIILVMALMSYLPRVLPLALFRKKIKNKYVQSFLLYMPYGILAAMVFPEILYSTSNFISSVIGTAVAFLLSYKNRGLLIVALGATAAVFVTELIMRICGFAV